MFLKSALTAALLCAALPAFAEGITISDAYARVSGPSAKSGAAFMIIENAAAADDRLIAATSEVAAKVELHTHTEDAAGVMQMVHVPEGFVIPAQGQHALARGGDHVMLMGLTGPLAQGDSFKLTLTFKNAGAITLDVPVDLTRDESGMMQQGGKMGHGHAAHGASN